MREPTDYAKVWKKGNVGTAKKYIVINTEEKLPEMSEHENGMLCLIQINLGNEGNFSVVRVDDVEKSKESIDELQKTDSIMHFREEGTDEVEMIINADTIANAFSRYSFMDKEQRKGYSLEHLTSKRLSKEDYGLMGILSRVVGTQIYIQIPSKEPGEGDGDATVLNYLIAEDYARSLDDYVYVVREAHTKVYNENYLLVRDSYSTLSLMSDINYLVGFEPKDGADKRGFHLVRVDNDKVVEKLSGKIIIPKSKENCFSFTSKAGLMAVTSAEGMLHQYVKSIGEQNVEVKYFDPNSSTFSLNELQMLKTFNEKFPNKERGICNLFSSLEKIMWDPEKNEKVLYSINKAGDGYQLGKTKEDGNLGLSAQRLLHKVERLFNSPDQKPKRFREGESFGKKDLTLDGTRKNNLEEGIGEEKKARGILTLVQNPNKSGGKEK